MRVFAIVPEGSPEKRLFDRTISGITGDIG